MRKKIAIIGMGKVGTAIAWKLFDRGDCDIVLVDIVEGLPQGIALDLWESGPLMGVDTHITGTNNFEETADSDIVITTAGKPRGPGMSRSDLLSANMDIVGGIAQQIVKYSPKAIVISVTNPLDPLVYHILKVSGLPRERVIGLSGVLDSLRFRSFIAQELNVSVRGVHAYVLGDHSDSMVPIASAATVAGIPLAYLLPEERIKAIVQRTQKGGGEVVKLLGTSASHAPAAGIFRMVDSILLNRHQILPCAVLLKGEYGIDDTVIGVHVKLGDQGVEEIIELKLSEEEAQAFRHSAEETRKSIQMMYTCSAGSM